MRYPVSFKALNLNIFHNAPDWRYRILKNIDPILKHYQRRHEADHNDDYDPIGNYLLRFIDDCDVEVALNPVYVLSDDFTEIIEELPADLRDKFTRIRHRHLRKNKQRKYILNTPRLSKEVNTQWRIRHLQDIDDEWIRKLILAFSGIEYNKAINTALQMRVAPSHEEILRYIGYCIFLNKSDIQIAKMWNLSPAVIEALRMLFFDYTRLPVNTVAKLAFFRQFVVNGAYTQTDFNFFKLLNELGDTGLKAITSFSLLDGEDEEKIEKFYGTSMLENVLRLKLSIRDSNDAMNYSNVINQLGTYYLKKSELRLSGAKTRNLDATTRKIESDMGNTIREGGEHEKLLDSVRNMQGEIRVLSLEEKEQPNYRPITALK